MDVLKNNKINIFMFALWLIITVLAAFHHELWRDEAQVWCIVRDSSISEIYNIASIEGHQLLWFIFVYPFAKLGMTPLSMNVLSLLSVSAAVLLLLFKPPFNYLTKALIVFSSGLLYFLPVIARSYALIPLFLFFTAFLYEKRHEHPYKYAAVLILLSNTHPFILALSAALFLLFAFEEIKTALKTKDIKAVIPSSVVFLNFIYLAFFLLPTIVRSHAIVSYMNSPKSFPAAVKEFPLLFFEFNMPDILGAALFYIPLIIIAAVLFKYSKKIFFLFAASAGYIFILYYKIWFDGITGQKAYILLLSVIFCLWLFNLKYKNYVLNAAAAVMLVISCINSFYLIKNEIKYNFSDAPRTARFIKENLKDEKVFCTVGAGFTFTPIAAFLPDKKFYSYINKYYITYHDFNVNAKKRMAPEPDCRYFIVQKDYYLNDDFEIIFAGSDKVLSSKEYQEIFNIYKLKAESSSS